MKLTPLEDWIMAESGLTERKRELLEAYQLNRLRETLRYAKSNSRFYRESLRTVDPDEIRSFESLKALPFTEPRQISDNPLDFLCVSQSEISRIVTLRTSGTSGGEKRIYFTQEDLEHTIRFFKYGMSCLVDKSDRVLILLPGFSYGSIGDLLKKALSAAGIVCLVHGVMTDARETAACLAENKITCIVGIPIQVMQLARTQKEAFKNIKKVLLSTDYVPQVLITELTNAFGCMVFTHYGMTEMGYGGGVECEALSGYHMREADLYFEIVDPVSGLPVPDGQTGEVVFTTLTRKAMPLIRYKTGDIASFSRYPCSCGTFLKTMNRVQGRINNRICLGDNMFVTLAELDEIILSFRGIMNYNAYLSEEYCLYIEIAAESSEAFVNVKNEIARSVCKFIFYKFTEGVKLPIKVICQTRQGVIVNSMVKRKIHDFKSSEL